ncbi:WhiB family transcriptional regulator [Schaalia sp. 19OD2882]|uniref:WhiB family transcriptional regulator n=1 Tax=Schaalia sp. 19OD2882 TaxID=2794089 RepID=UPI0020A8116C|nr:WhiB family transcriptional regulator [Schaalia sp. 19OD2882]
MWNILGEGPVTWSDADAHGFAVADGPLAWQQLALCAQTDPEAFFPEKGGSTREAKAVCHACDVREQCLEYALANDERFGIWGGLSERERRRLRRSAV